MSNESVKVGARVGNNLVYGELIAPTFDTLNFGSCYSVLTASAEKYRPVV
jgi:hypothetical protein